MIKLLISILVLIMVAMIFHKTVQFVKSINKDAWGEQKWRFILLVISQSLIAGGAVAVLFDIQWAAHALVIGVGGKYTYDRRLFDIHRTRLDHANQTG